MSDTIEKELALGRGSESVRLYCNQQKISAMRSAMSSLWEKTHLLFFFTIVIIFDFAVLLLNFMFLKIAVLEADIAGLCFFMVLTVASIPALCLTVIIQGLLFKFEAEYDISNGNFRLKYGLLKFSKRMDLASTIMVIQPAHDRAGNWGYGMDIRLRHWKFGFPFIPKGTIGEKNKACGEARKIRDWIENRGVTCTLRKFENLKD